MDDASDMIGDDRSRAVAAAGDPSSQRRLLAEGLEEAGFLVAVFDRGGRYLDVNNSVCALVGYERDEFLELKVGDLAVRPTAAAAIRRQLRRHGVAEGAIDVRSRTGESYRLGFLSGKVMGGIFDGCFVGIAWLDR
jgi:PAS domain S-box-containing protein